MLSGAQVLECKTKTPDVMACGAYSGDCPREGLFLIVATSAGHAVEAQLLEGFEAQLFDHIRQTSARKRVTAAALGIENRRGR